MQLFSKYLYTTVVTIIIVLPYSYGERETMEEVFLIMPREFLEILLIINAES